MTENQIEEQILEYLNTTAGYFAWKNPSTGFHDGNRWRKQSSPWAINGVADIICIGPDASVHFIEVKTPKGIQSQAQKNFEARISEFGVCYDICRSLADAKRLF